MCPSSPGLMRVDKWLWTARLFKTVPELSDASHPARGHNKEPFGRRRYVTLCLALSALARADAQTTLGSLADDVLTAAAEPELAATGFTPHAYILKRRIEAAQILLLDEENPIAWIALEVGFSGQAHFSSAFKKIVGVSPRQWRTAIMNH